MEMINDLFTCQFIIRYWRSFVINTCTVDIKSETQARESGDFMDYENDYEEDDYDDDYDYLDDELAENERLADTEQAEALDTEADENKAAGTENDAADSGDEQ